MKTLKIFVFAICLNFGATAFAGNQQDGGSSLDSEKSITGEAYFSDAANLYPGDSNASERLWRAICTIAKERAINEANYKCEAQGKIVKVSRFRDNGKCSGMFFSVGYTATLNYVCGNQ